MNHSLCLIINIKINHIIDDILDKNSKINIIDMFNFIKNRNYIKIIDSLYNEKIKLHKKIEKDYKKQEKQKLEVANKELKEIYTNFVNEQLNNNIGLHEILKLWDERRINLCI